MFKVCLLIGMQFFIGWTVVSEIWLFFCLFVAVLYPIVDGRDVLVKAGRLAWGAVAGKSGKVEESGASNPGSARDSVLEMREEVRVVNEGKI